MSGSTRAHGSKRYRFVDFAAASQVGFRNHIVPVDTVAGLVRACGAYDCFASIFQFSDDVLLYLAEHQVDGRPSIAGYDGRVWAPFLPLDIDAHPPAGDLGAALAVARQCWVLLVDRWEVPATALHVYFSGAKGFHLLIDVRAFGRVVPSYDLHRVFSRARLDILHALPDSARPLFDLAIGDKVRLLRLPNTRHATSGLYKVPLTAAELLGASVESIRELAAAPRPLDRVGAAGLLPREPVDAAPHLEQVWHRARRVLRHERGPHPYHLASEPATPESALCAARRRMWETAIPPGLRNNVAIRLASALRLGGFDQARTAALLAAWNGRQPVPLPERELHAVVRSAYLRPYPYTYGCHDEVVRSFCPYVDRLSECEDYRVRHPRAAHA